MGVSTGLAEDIFQFVDKPYDLRNNNILLKKINIYGTVFYATESFSFLAQKYRALIAQSLKHKTEFKTEFKTKIKTWTVPVPMPMQSVEQIFR